MPTSQPSSPSKRWNCDIKGNTILAPNRIHEMRAHKVACNHIEEPHFRYMFFEYLSFENVHNNFDTIRTNESTVVNGSTENY